MTTSETPRTDAAFQDWDSWNGGFSVEVARQLERELAEARRAGEALAASVWDACNDISNGDEESRAQAYAMLRAALAQWEEAKK